MTPPPAAARRWNCRPAAIASVRLELRPGARIIGAAGATTLEFTGGGAFITADQADGILLEGLVLDGAYQALDDGLVSIAQFAAGCACAI